MTEDDFLKRWSRRKREVAKAEAAPLPQPEAAPADQAADAPEADKPEFDIASLPPLESINALTDVTAFLRAGVPADLTRAALRRVWTADPSIRDFVGLAENAWDFTDPAAMPGFGPLESSDEIRRMIASLVDRIGEAARPVEAIAPQSDENSNNSNEVNREFGQLEADNGPERSIDAEGESSNGKVLLQSSKEDVAPQHDVAEGQPEPVQISRRTHGSALPQ